MESLPVSDLGTNAKHMDGLYLWRVRKRGQRIHIENPETKRAYCQVKNCSGGKPLDGRGAEIPAGRRVCGNCIDLVGREKDDYQEPSLAVLMGERMVDVEPELFASAVAPKPRERKKPTRPSNGSNVRKPKRSNVKYLNPFNDDLPW